MEGQLKSISEIRAKYQTTIPQDIREKMSLEIGDGLIWTYDEEKDEIKIIKKPQSFSNALWGIGLGIKKEEPCNIKLKDGGFSDGDRDQVGE